MLGNSPYYYQSIKTSVVAFMTLFDDIEIERNDGKIVDVPLIFSDKEKYYDVNAKEGDAKVTEISQQLPIMGIEMINLSRNSDERWASYASQICSGEKIFTREIYDLKMELTIKTRLINDLCNIIEQIVAHFNPEITVSAQYSLGGTVRNIDIPVVFDGSVPLNIDKFDTGENNTIRELETTLSFTLPVFIFKPVKDATGVIKKVIVDLETINKTPIERYLTKVVPIDANAENYVDIEQTCEKL